MFVSLSRVFAFVRACVHVCAYVCVSMGDLVVMVDCLSANQLKFIWLLKMFYEVF